MKILLLGFLTIIALRTSAQSTDYAKLRPTVMVMTCGALDSGIVNTSLRNLLTLDTSRIEKNMHMYYEDLGQCYWLKSGGDDGSHYLQLSIEATSKALYHDPKSSKALWNLAFAHTMSGDCDMGKSYIEKYKLVTKKKYWDEEQIQLLLERCSM